MVLPVLSSKKPLKGKRVLVRVDWNVPLSGAFSGENSLKLERSFPLLIDLLKRDAVVIVMTHLGRPKKHEVKFSTRKLLPLVRSQSDIALHWLGAALDSTDGLVEAQKIISEAHPGTGFLLENVRFLKGEEENEAKVAAALASLGDIFINDAFAVCHRAHASVVGVAKRLPAYAGPALMNEIEGLEPLIKKPKSPFYAFVGGAKLSTKLELLERLVKLADRVYIGGAMAHPFFVAQKKAIGKSLYDPKDLPLARKFLKHNNLRLPSDVAVATKIADGVKVRVAIVGKIKLNERIGDIGPATMMSWSDDIKKAKTLLWNGPFGVIEVGTFVHGSFVLAKAIAAQSRGSCYGVAGGGDTLPLVLEAGVSDRLDHVSTGGGAMLEYIAMKGKLPGIEALRKRPRDASFKTEIKKSKWRIKYRTLCLLVQK
mgnify:CR=1 FL=1